MSFLPSSSMAQSNGRLNIEQNLNKKSPLRDYCSVSICSNHRCSCYTKQEFCTQRCKCTFECKNKGSATMESRLAQKQSREPPANTLTQKHQQLTRELETQIKQNKELEVLKLKLKKSEELNVKLYNKNKILHNIIQDLKGNMRVSCRLFNELL
ncbi:uncharacterized protein LOC120359679 [Solenopsis invicta]|uniref:uncharacterized protein LOC120359679 n=1 Tax=Solenopsis invicta TaxID=13686 RepID=UPI00193D5465|nr:uncharacterized protein LOC120359679 [Solenopsis invicta]